MSNSQGIINTEYIGHHIHLVELILFQFPKVVKIGTTTSGTTIPVTVGARSDYRATAAHSISSAVSSPSSQSPFEIRTMITCEMVALLFLLVLSHLNPTCFAYSLAAGNSSLLYQVEPGQQHKSSGFVRARFFKWYHTEHWKRLGFYDDSFLDYIDEHWMEYPPQKQSVHFALGSMYIIFWIVGCSGNLLVIFMYLRCRPLRTPGNALIFNLALSDFFMIAKTPVTIINSFYEGPALGYVGCSLYGFLGGLSGMTTISTLTAIAYDRYTVVVRPLQPLKNINSLRAKCLIIFCWSYAFCFSSLPLLNIGISNYVPEGYLTSCSFNYLSKTFLNRAFIVIFFCAGWILPLILISFCYFKILIEVTLNRRTCNMTNLSAKHVREQTVRKGEIKLALLVICVILLFFISWTPYAVVTLLAVFGFEELITPTISMVPAILCKTAACINPYLYIITHPKFKKEFIKLVGFAKNTKQELAVKSLKHIGKNYGLENTFKDEEVEIIEVGKIPINNQLKISAICISHNNVLSRQKSFDYSNLQLPPSWYKEPIPKQGILKRALSNKVL